MFVAVRTRVFVSITTNNPIHRHQYLLVLLSYVICSLGSILFNDGADQCSPYPNFIGLSRY